MWLWTMLQKLLLDNFVNKPIFLVTNVDKVKNISEKTKLKHVELGDIPIPILDIIESWWKLLSDDKVYFNKKLYFNEIFYSIILDDYENNK